MDTLWGTGPGFGYFLCLFDFDFEMLLVKKNIIFKVPSRTKTLAIFLFFSTVRTRELWNRKTAMTLNSPVSEINEFKPRLKSAKNWF